MVCGSLYGMELEHGNEKGKTVSASTNNTAPVKKELTVYIFGSPGCLQCKRLEVEILPAYEKKYGVTVKVQLLTLDVPENYEKLVSLEKKLNKNLTKIPAMYAGGRLFGGNDEILGNIDAVFKDHQAEEPAAVDAPVVPGIKSIAAKRLQLLPILFAGVVDSINPCAFATIVFFLSYMSLVLKKSRSEVFFAGLVFIAAVFITYFFIGVGIFKAVLGLTGILKYSKFLYIIIGIFVLFLSGRHFYEAAVLKRTGKLDDEEVKMKLPHWIRTTIEKLITRFTAMKFILPFVFLLAVLITLFQLACTVQVYLPSIIYLTSIPEYRASAFLFLLLYCFLFVLPLILIFVMYYFGLTTLALKRFFKDKIVTMKLAMATFFLIMAVFMILEGIR
jgi:cytochrome c biogenesis protein CcdA